DPTPLPTDPTTPLPTTAPPVPSPTGDTALIGATGAKVRTAAEIQAWGDALGYGSVWTEQQVLDTACMAEHGFRFDPEFDRSASYAETQQGMTAEQFQAFQDALYGPQTGQPYDWRTAGC